MVEAHCACDNGKVGLLAYTLKEQEAEKRGVWLFLLCLLLIQSKIPVHVMVLPTFREDLHFSVNLLPKHPQRHARMCAPLIT